MVWSLRKYYGENHPDVKNWFDLTEERRGLIVQKYTVENWKTAIAVEFAALEDLRRAATEVGADIRHQPGLRIGVVIADGRTLIYTPTARLVEAGENTHGAANAICLGAAPRNLEADLGLDQGAAPQVGRRFLGTDQVESVKNALELNPPQKFDLARKVRIFNSFIEFVELEVLGTEVSRRTVTIPSHLLAVADARTREQLHATLRLVPSDNKLSGEAIDRDRKLLTKRFLHVIPRYGTVVHRRDKEEFERGINDLRAAVVRFSKAVREQIQGAIDKNRDELVSSLLPALSQRPPREWVPSSGNHPDKATIRHYLEQDLKAAFGTADQLIREMKVRVMFKGVTYELLSDPAFLKAATTAIPDLERFHTETDAAEATKEVSGQDSVSAPQR